jgi:hypothetical protein
MNHLTITPDLAISETGFLFLSSTGETFTVNELGKRILKSLQEGMSQETIVGAISKEFDVDPAEAQRDFLDFVGLLKHLHLVAGA